MSDIPAVNFPCPVRRVGNGDKHYFFGYYNKNVWDRSGRYFLSNRVEMLTKDLNGSEIAQVGYFDLDNNDEYHAIGETTTWNWQMGCQLQWLEGKEEREIIYNVRSTNGEGTIYPDFCSKIYNVETGEERALPLPVYVVAPNSKYALCVNYSRFEVTHKTIGYRATDNEPELELAPADDGIHYMDIETGESHLIVNLQQLKEFNHVPSMEKAIHWVTHLEINPGSSRLLFLHRWTERVEDETCFLHRLFSVNPDGSDLRLLECTDHPLPQLADDFDIHSVGTFDYEKSEYQISHPVWRNDISIMVWGPHNGSIHYHLYDDLTVEATVVGRECLTENGHMSYSDDDRWLLSDTYPDAETNERFLIIYDAEKDIRYNIGSFYTSPDLGKHNRCDLHPRFSPCYTKVCMDSVHENIRQRYIIDIAELLQQG
ncbi:hypothetical protein VIN01S_24400 [Vibrio inusitatus NBRC 102082]|uniref:Uncharacterized protein n=1 Tax=Vibrio inusitatus NBRC 102082 TaxID=1219070 RepID=A0A4Y3HWY3_9VIBR|nr:hypothetical protein [Vibrio inusitatus]GEA51636.1 hypothetical protein VIN01S_24400 [Vibrio inusitatus NBRC 102082]